MSKNPKLHIISPKTGIIYCNNPYSPKSISQNEYVDGNYPPESNLCKHCTKAAEKIQTTIENNDITNPNNDNYTLFETTFNQSKTTQKKPKKNQNRKRIYPYIVSWSQGLFDFTLDLVTGRLCFKKTKKQHFGKPTDTFKIISFSEQKPRQQYTKFDGINEILNAKSINSVKKKSPRLRERTPPQRNLGSTRSLNR